MCQHWHAVCRNAGWRWVHEFPCAFAEMLAGVRSLCLKSAQLLAEGQELLLKGCLVWGCLFVKGGGIKLMLSSGLGDPVVELSSSPFFAKLLPAYPTWTVHPPGLQHATSVLHVLTHTETQSGVEGEVNLEQVWKKKGSVDAWFVAAKVFAEVGTQKFCFVLKKPIFAVMLICVRVTEKAFQASLGSSLWPGTRCLCLFRAARDSVHPAVTESFAHLGEISLSAAPRVGGTSAIAMLPWGHAEGGGWVLGEQEDSLGRETCLFKDNLKHLHLSQPEKRGSLLSKVSVLTTLERRFNLQSADVGVIASSFEIGNLALILFVSYFGARGHRPRLIGCGGIVMALGALLSALPEFLTHQYEYESGEIRWGAEGRDVCAANGSTSDEGPDPDLICRNRTATNMMYLLLIGAQVLLGIGATPVQPLGVSYIDDHVRRKDSSLYIGLATRGNNCGVYCHWAMFVAVFFLIIARSLSRGYPVCDRMKRFWLCKSSVEQLQVISSNLRAGKRQHRETAL
ncbi:Solute carrier organic anion transporter family member 3A1 [Anas platyrhynchos]|uniref:Solute carrier organic anion transporter family member 3A1 n=1 Tax=Anas platyrhynchos TaxID=8839 RepID=R0JJJ7_ANAPL|nr:Solute carrier organic anion transporter family member 3A1 [Anas platyrhynchos]